MTLKPLIIYRFHKSYMKKGVERRNFCKKQEGDLRSLAPQGEKS